MKKEKNLEWTGLYGDIFKLTEQKVSESKM
jgi:hypothetical protein